MVRQCLLFWCLMPSVGLCLFISLLHSVSAFNSTHKAIHEVFGNVLRQHDRISCWGLAILLHDVSNHISFFHVMLNAIDCVFAQWVSDFYFRSLSSPFVHPVVSFVYWLVWDVYELSVCVFRAGCKFSLVDYDGILSSDFIDCGDR